MKAQKSVFLYIIFYIILCLSLSGCLNKNMEYLITQRMEKNNFSHQEILSAHFWEQKLTYGNLSDRSILLAFYPLYLIKIGNFIQKDIDSVQISPANTDEEQLHYFSQVLYNDNIDTSTALEFINDSENIEQYCQQIIKTDNDYLKIALLQKLSKDPKLYKQYIVQLLSDENEFVRMESISILSNITDKSILTYLYSSLNDDSPLVRVQSCKAIEKLNFPESIDYLRKLLLDPEVYVRRNVAEILQRMTGKKITYPQ